MRNLLLPLFLALLPFSLSAQLNDLLKDPNVAWAATFETEHDFRLHVEREHSSLQLKKFTGPASGCMDFRTDNWLADWILHEMKAGRYKAYEDPGLSMIVVHSTLMNKVSTTDTVITFHPDTYEERVLVVQNDLNSGDIKFFRTQQVIYYNKTSGSYGTRLLAIAPMISLSDAQGKKVGTFPLAWLAMDGGTTNDANLQNPAVIWAAMLVDKANDLEISKLKVVKNEWKTGFAEQLLKEGVNPKHQVESSKGFGCGKMLTKKDVEYLYTAIDTVITFNPATFEETMQVISNNFTPKDLKKIRLVQEWYFDDRSKRMSNRLMAVSPLQQKFDETGQELLYNFPMYYIRF